VARTGERIGAYRILVGDLMERSILEDLGMDGSKIIKWIFKNGMKETLIWLRIGTVGRSL
jgi:hypothetical protein